MDNLQIIDFTSNDDPVLQPHKADIMAMYRRLDELEQERWRALMDKELFEKELSMTDLSERWTGNSTLSVLFLDGAAIGFAKHSPTTEECGARWKDLSALYIDENHRESGYGSMLIRHVQELAFHEDADELILSVNVNNPSAARLYAELGFRESVKTMMFQVIK